MVFTNIVPAFVGDENPPTVDADFLPVHSFGRVCACVYVRVCVRERQGLIEKEPTHC